MDNQPLVCLRQLLFSQKNATKARHAVIASSFPFPVGVESVKARNVLVVACLSAFKGQLPEGERLASLTAWLEASIHAPITDFLHTADMLTADAADDIECVLTLRNWCHALDLPCAGDIAECRQLIRAHFNDGVHPIADPEVNITVTLDEEYVDACDTPTKKAIAEAFVPTTEGVDLDNPKALFDSLVGKVVSSAEVQLIRQRIANPVPECFDKDSLRALTQAEREVMALVVGVCPDALNRQELLKELHTRSIADITNDHSALWSRVYDYWSATHISDMPFPMASVQTHRVKPGMMLPFVDGDKSNPRFYFFQVTSVVQSLTAEKSSYDVELTNLSGGGHFRLPSKCVLNSSSVSNVWVFNNPSTSSRAGQITDSLVSGLAFPPPLTVIFPGTLIQRRSEGDATKKRGAEEIGDESYGLGSGRGTFTFPRLHEDVPNQLLSNQVQSDVLDFSSSRGVTASEAQSYQAGLAGRVLLGSTYSTICQSGTFNSPAMLTLVQLALSSHLLQLPLTADAKMLKNFFQLNLALNTSNERRDSGFHIQFCLNDRKEIKSAAALSKAIVNFSAIWDLCIDKEGRTFFMRSATSQWIARLAVGMPDSIAHFAPALLVYKFMCGLLKIAGYVREVLTARLSRDDLLLGITEQFAFNTTDWLSESMNPMYAQKGGKIQNSFFTSSSSASSSSSKYGQSSSSSKTNGSKAYGSNARSVRSNPPPPPPPAAASGEVRPCYATMMHKWGDHPKPCRNTRCTDKHDLSGFSKTDLTVHANRLLGQYSQAVRNYVANM